MKLTIVIVPIFRYNGYTVPGAYSDFINLWNRIVMRILQPYEKKVLERGTFWKTYRLKGLPTLNP